MAVVQAAELLERRVLLTTFYVDTSSANASDNNPGTSITAPLKTIGQAFDLVENNPSASGDTVLIRGGNYYEQPFLYSGGGGASALDRTIISAYVNPNTGTYEPVYIDAAKPVTQIWSQVGSSNIWYLNNFTTETSGVWVDWRGNNDGPSLQQIGTYDAGYYDNRVITGTGVSSMYPGTYYGDIADSRLYVWLSDGSDPNSHAIEFADQAHAIYQPGTPDDDGGYSYANNVDFVGLNLRHVNVYDTSGQDSGCAMYAYGDERLIDCNIQWNTGVGVYLRDQSEMIDCISSNNGQNGAVGQGQGFLISGGQYDDNYWRQYLDGSNAGIKVVTNSPVNYGDIENADVSGNDGQGIWFDTCFESSAVSQIIGNVVRNNQGTGLDLEASRNFLVADNIVIGNRASGISLNAAENAGIYNNTLVGNYGIAAIQLDGGVRDQGSEYPGITGMLNNTVENNIIVNNFTVYDLDIPTLAAGSEEINNNTSDYNLFYRWGSPLHFTTGGTYLGWGQTPSTLADWRTDSGQDAHSVVADPLFLATGAGTSYYQLSEDSPAIGRGVIIPAVTTDYAGNARPASGGYSIGAFEYDGGGVGTAGAIITNTDPNVWVDDQLPANAAMTAPDESGNAGENQFWRWNNTNVYSGAASLDSGTMSGPHRQYFTGADPRAVGTDDLLWAYVWIDPASPPQEIMLEWQDSSGSWAHQAYWGANLINGGVDGSVAGQNIGSLPTAGQWALLAVPASAVGLAGESITGFSFDLYDGHALADKIGTGALPVNDTLNINSGQYRFGFDTRTDNPNLIVNVAAGATVTFASLPGQGIQAFSLASLNLTAGATAVLQPSDSSADLTVLVVSAIKFGGVSASPLGLLDVTNNDVIIHNGGPAALTAALAAGYAGGAWAGTGGIVSSTAAADPTFLTAVGMATGMSGAFDGQTISSTDVELKYTYYGDANLDRIVDGSDYTRIDNGFNTGQTGWYNGDFNYDGTVNGNDYTLIDNAFNMQGVTLAVPNSTPLVEISRSTALLVGVSITASEMTSLKQASYLIADPSLAEARSVSLLPGITGKYSGINVVRKLAVQDSRLVPVQRKLLTTATRRKAVFNAEAPNGLALDSRGGISVSPILGLVDPMK